MKLMVITGPTASGKTAISAQLAKRLDGEIINADSMQIYKYMDIGTAKPSAPERNGVPHHMMDIAMPDENYSVARYCHEARRCIADVFSRGKTPVLVGGTGLYIDSIVNNIQFAEIPADEKYRDKMVKEAAEKGNSFIYDILASVDPESALSIELNDTRRIVRALEVYHVSGKTLTWHKKKSREVPPPFEAKLYAVNMDREQLYSRINSRVDAMFEQGLINETETLVDMGIDKDCTAMQAIGYKEILLYLGGEIALDEAKDMIKQGSRRYAKRQLTWFRKNGRIKWMEYSSGIEERILQDWKG